MTRFGTIITGRQVRAAVEATTKLWIRDYLGEVARIDGRAMSALPAFRSYVSALDFERQAENQLPTCVTVAPGLMTRPERHGKVYRSRWAVGIGAVVGANDRESTLALAELYGAAVRSLILQRQSLGGFAEGVTWEGERYDDFTDLNDEDLPSLAAAVLQFGVDIESTVDVSAGPAAPTDPATPLTEGAWGNVAAVIVDEEALTP